MRLPSHCRVADPSPPAEFVAAVLAVSPECLLCFNVKQGRWQVWQPIPWMPGQMMLAVDWANESGGYLDLDWKAPDGTGIVESLRLARVLSPVDAHIWHQRRLAEQRKHEEEALEKAGDAAAQGLTGRMYQAIQDNQPVGLSREELRPYQRELSEGDAQGAA